VALTVADTDVLIDSLRGREPSKGRIERELKTGGLATTVVNAFELLSGARTAAELQKVEKLLAALAILPLDEEAGRQAAEVRRTLEKAGQPIGMADYLIAGICLARSATLLTRNRDHFDRVSELSLGDLG
jgi:tRNA(fMet)-specific endonuclease VapC